MTTATAGVVTLGDLARHFKRPAWMIRRLFERRLLAEPERVGAYRVIPVSEIPKVETALRAAGYIAADEPRMTY